LRAITGQRADAARLLDEARAICIPLGAVPAIGRADALAARLATPEYKTQVAYPAGLSAREVQVLQLLAAGHSNRAIADTLFLSERTVQVHVRHIFTKIGADNRAGAATFALRHNLA
jgi:DNA-binding NarL/FixJ family response regulator